MLGRKRVSLSFPGETAEFFNQTLSLEFTGSGSSPCRFSGFTYFLLLRVMGVGQVNLEEPGGRKQKGRRDDSHPEAEFVVSLILHLQCLKLGCRSLSACPFSVAFLFH